MSTAVLPPPSRSVSSNNIVDLTNDAELPTPLPKRRRANNGRAVPVASHDILIVESDDEDITSRAGPSGSRTRRFVSPPPPRASTSSVPPVPELPRRGGTLPQGVIMPFANPLFDAIGDRLASFGRNMASLRSSTPSSAAPAAARPSHHVPRMGLGGGLLARLDDSARERRALIEFQRQHAMRHRRAAMAMMGIEDYDPDEDSLDGLSDRDPALARPFQSFAGVMTTRVIQPNKPDYRPDYTHRPAIPDPGFTYDFEQGAPDARRVEILDDNGDMEIEELAPTTQTTTLLVCARCNDPLVWNGEGPNRLWALRCGHMLDGKCVDALMHKPKPAGLEGLDEETPAPKVVDRKGKGKAKAPPPESEPGVTDGAGSIRSRLRTRPAPPAPPAKKRTSILKKGKGKASVATKIDEHEWACPVPKCRRAHVADLLKDGPGHEGEVRWVHREGEGPLPIFPA
ncbi:hypothetical protein PENSPDRAFT_683541 [Peniophora sp. CONT]|nr:hypothetical protein PENSPDRAFT_683541 [Peniophora sp. CONT]